VRNQAESGGLSPAAWLRRGEIECANIQCDDYDTAAFKAALYRVRSLTRELPPDFTSIVQRECGQAGVCIAFVPELPGTRTWGATRWLNPNRPLIQLSLRYKTDDHLWFTFFHEAAHILLHGRRDVFLEDEERQQTQEENEADTFARNILIPETKYRIFRRLSTHNCAAISRFAYELGIAPGIVVGRMQHDHLLDRYACNTLKKPVDWVFKHD